MRGLGGVLACGLFVSMMAVGSGCDGIGEPIVDRRIPKPPTLGKCGSEPPACAAPERAFVLDAGVPEGARPIDLPACAGGAADCAAGDAGAGDAGVEQMRIVADDGSMPPSLRDARLSNTNLSIESTTPSVFTLEHCWLEDVYVRLDGPVTLRIAEPTSLARVGIASAAGSGARVEVSDAAAVELAVGDAARGFDGALHVARSTLDVTRLAATSIELDNVDAELIEITAHDLITTDTRLTAARVGAERAVLSASTLVQVHVDRCGSLMLSFSNFQDGELPACRDEPLRVYGSTVSQSTVDGAIDSDHSGWTQTRLGVHAPTDLLAWNGTFDHVNFCAHARSARMGDTGNEVRCSDCDALALSPEPLCEVPNGVVVIKGNLCDALSPRPVPDCEGPAPPRPRVMR
jgi:hypothetical protein